MARKKKAQSEDAVLCPFVKFTAETIHRSQIKNAEYNPRAIREGNREKLKANLKRVGLINALIWNRTTGNLVGGHQRIAILDSLMRTQDYLIPVDVVELSEAEEKAQNVALNNSDMQGTWDLVKMKDLVTGGLDLEGAGLDVGEVTAVFGMDVISGLDAPQIESLAQQIRDSQEKHDALVKAGAGKDRADFYRVLVFKDKAAAQWVAELLDSPNEMLLNGALLRQKWEARRGEGRN